jgi:hypothetical protein
MTPRDHDLQEARAERERSQAALDATMRKLASEQPLVQSLRKIRQQIESGELRWP